MPKKRGGKETHEPEKGMNPGSSRDGGRPGRKGKGEGPDPPEGIGDDGGSLL